MAWAQFIAEGMKAVGAAEEGEANELTLNTEAQIADQNAIIAKQNAGTTRAEASQAEEAQRRAARKALGGAAASIAQAGIGTDGSALAALTQSSTEAELDALNIRYGGEKEAYALEREAEGFARSAPLLRKQAKSARLAGKLGAGGSMLSGVSNYRTSQAKSRSSMAGG